MLRPVVVVLLAAATAHAQAPGQVPPPPTTPSVMIDRWAVGLAIGTASLTPQVAGAPHTGFGLLALAGRFRIYPRFEVELELELGGAKGNLAYGGLSADARYRFLVGEPWNWFLLGGLGVTGVHASNATGVDAKGRGSIRIGAGVERRFDRFALGAELRLLAIGANDAAADDGTLAAAFAHDGVSGVSITVGGSYYF